MKTSMPANTTAQLESDAQSARKQGAAAASVMVDRRASAGTSQALQAKLQDGPHAAQLRVLQAKMAGQPLAAAQRAGIEEEEPLQGKFETAQRASLEEEEPLQGKFETAQRASLEEEEPLQGKFGTAQAESKKNDTGMPDGLKSGIESLSGMAMDDVKVHYDSSQPTMLNAHAYAQGSDIHVAPGQEKHLPHEAWHVVQQRQGRVQPTTQMAGVQVNDDQGLEHEADVMGAKALDQSSS